MFINSISKAVTEKPVKDAISSMSRLKESRMSVIMNTCLNRDRDYSSLVKASPFLTHLGVASPSLASIDSSLVNDNDLYVTNVRDYEICNLNII